MVDLVKFTKHYEKQVSPFSLAADTRAFLSGRVVTTQWYPLAYFHDILAALDDRLWHGSEERALELGAGGGAAMRGLQKTYGQEGPLSSVLAMRHAWRAHYDFGVLSAETPNDSMVRFTVDGYPDMPMTHGMMTAGWGLAAARMAGASSARAEILERPWLGAKRFVYQVRL